MSTKDNDTFTAILAFLLLLPSAAWSGFVLVQLWGWFVVPLGVPNIGVWQAAGLFMVSSWMSGVMSRDNNDERSPGELLLLMAFIPAFMWVFGAIYHWLMLVSA